MEYQRIVQAAENKLLLYAGQSNITNDQDKDARTAVHQARQAIQTWKTADPTGPWKIWAEILTKAFRTYYQSREKRYQETRDTALRRAQILLGQKFDSAVANSNPEQYLATAIQHEYTSEAVLSEANQRHCEIVYLVHSIDELSKMFEDLAMLVKEQSETLNTIESNVERAIVHVKKGNENLQQTTNLQKRNRKLYCCGCVCLLVIIAIVVISSSVAVNFRST